MKIEEYREMMRYLTRPATPEELSRAASVERQEYATGGRVGFAGGSGKKILELIIKANKKLKGEKSMETVNPKTGEVTVPKEPIATAEKKYFYDKNEEYNKLMKKHKKAAEAHDQLFNVDIYDKIAPSQLVEVMAEMMGKNVDNLTDAQSREYFIKAQSYLTDFIKIDRTRKAVDKFNQGLELNATDRLYLKFAQPADSLPTTKTFDISDPKVAEDFTNFARENDPEGFKKIQEIVDDINNKNILDDFNIKNRDPNAEGGRVELQDGTNPNKNFKIIKKAYEKIKKETGRLPTQAEVHKKTGLSFGIISRTQDDLKFSKPFNIGTEASKKFFMEKISDKIKPTYYDRKLGIKGPKADIEKYEKDYKKRFKFSQSSQDYLQAVKKGTILSNEALAKKYNINIADVERINIVLRIKNKLKYPKQTYEGERKRMRARDARRKEYINTASNSRKELFLQKNIKEIDPKVLAEKLDVAHRAPLKVYANMKTPYPFTGLGLDIKEINQKVVRPTEQKLGTIYENRYKLIKNLKPGEVPKEIQKKLEKLNIKISELVDRTGGLLQGALIDEKTLKVIPYGINYANVIGMGLIDKPVKKLTQADFDLIKANLPEQIKAAKNTIPKLFSDPMGVGAAVDSIKNIEIKAPNFLKKSVGLATKLGVPLEAVIGSISYYDNLREEGFSNLDAMAYGAYKGGTQDYLNFILDVGSLPGAVKRKIKEGKSILEFYEKKEPFFTFADDFINKKKEELSTTEKIDNLAKFETAKEENRKVDPYSNIRLNRLKSGPAGKYFANPEEMEAQRKELFERNKQKILNTDPSLREKYEKELVAPKKIKPDPSKMSTILGPIVFPKYTSEQLNLAYGGPAKFKKQLEDDLYIPPLPKSNPVAKEGILNLALNKKYD